jgi:hypothetical protein
MKKRKVVAAIVPARIRESRLECPHVECSLQKSKGERQVSNTLAKRALEKGDGASEQGPSSIQSSAVKRRRG